MPSDVASPGPSELETVDAPRPAKSQSPLPSGGALEVRRLREAIETQLFDRARDVVKIGRFTVLDRLGAGGMGVVYAAYDPTLDRKVAVKVLRREGGKHDRAQLVDEARALARLSHAGIVTVHEVGEHEEQVFLAMEYVEGESLDRWIAPDADGQLRPWREVVGVFARAGRGLAAAHDAGLVHRDFKPHNVMRGTNGAVKVLDFGLARVTPSETESPALHMTGPHGRASGSSTVTGALAGTPAYMSPEQLAGTRATARSDQFSFCVSLFEALHGCRPFAGRSLEEIAFAVLEGEIRSPPSRPHVPNFVRTIVRRGLSVDPDDRFGSMDALLDALDRDPAARRRRVGATLGLTTVVAGGVALWPAVPVVAAPCSDLGGALESTWGDAQRLATHEGLLASNHPRAAATWDRVAPLLDGYADAWLASNEQACRAHAEQHESAVTFDRRTRCLATRRAGLATATELLRSAQPEVVDRAAATVAALPSIASCATGEITAGEMSVEKPAIAAAIAEERDRLARARVLEEAGHYVEAQTLAEQADRAAQQLSFAPLRAEAAAVRGGIAMLVDSPDDAERVLTEALALAIESGHDRVAIEAVAKRAYVRAELQREVAPAHDDERHADALLARHSAATPRLRWLVDNNLGVVRERSEDLAGAQKRYTGALAHARARGDAGRLDAVASLTNLAYVANGGGDPTQGEAYASEAVALAELALGPEHPLLPMPLHALAEAQRDQAKDNDAAQTLRRSLAIHEQSGSAMPPPAITDMHMLATLAQRGGRIDEARAWAEQAAQLAKTVLPAEHPVALEVVALRHALAQ